MDDFLGGLFGDLAGASAIGAGVALGRDDLSDLRRDVVDRSGFTNQGTLASQVSGLGQFKPFTVTSAAGATNYGYDAQGNPMLSLQSTPLQSNLQNMATQMGSNINAPIAGLEGRQLQQQALEGATQNLSGVFAQDPSIGATRSELSGLLANQLGSYGQGAAQLGSLSQQALQMGQDRLDTVRQPEDVLAVRQELQQQGLQALGQETPTASSVYDQIRAMQSPEEERQRIALENRLAAQGRLGVQTAQYGGTPEQLALEKAQAEARNAASLQALGMSDQLASSQQQRAQGMLSQYGQMAGLGMDLMSQKQQLASNLAGLGMSAAQLGQGMTTQDLANITGLQQADIQAAQAQEGLQQAELAQTAGLFGLGGQAAMLPQEIRAARLQNTGGVLGLSDMQTQQQLAALNPALTLAGLNQQGQLAQLQATANLGTNELQMLRDIGLGRSTLTGEGLAALSKIFAGSGSEGSLEERLIGGLM